MLSLANQSSIVKNQDDLLIFLQRLFQVSSNSYSSIRQKVRNFHESVEMLSSYEFKALLQEVVLEEVSLAQKLNNPLFLIYSQIDAGIVYTQLNDFELARKWFKQAETNSINVTEISEQNKLLANTCLKWGHLERKAKTIKSQ